MSTHGPSTPTVERVLRTFLRLVAERGIEATTTRLLAEEAGVNEVTIFRLFGGKANLAAEAFRRFSSAEEFAHYPLVIDSSSSAHAAQGLLAVLSYLRNRMLERPEIVQFGMAEYWRFPDARDQIGATPRAARELVERALDAAVPALRPGLDRRAASLNLIGLLLVSVVWPARGWIELSEQDWQFAAKQAIDGLLRRP
jgi:AcrR family transcriptional regulator